MCLQDQFEPLQTKSMQQSKLFHCGFGGELMPSLKIIFEDDNEWLTVSCGASLLLFSQSDCHLRPTANSHFWPTFILCKVIFPPNSSSPPRQCLPYPNLRLLHSMQDSTPT